jgi:hypothetical protein
MLRNSLSISSITALQERLAALTASTSATGRRCILRSPLTKHSTSAADASASAVAGCINVNVIERMLQKLEVLSRQALGSSSSRNKAWFSGDT